MWFSKVIQMKRYIFSLLLVLSVLGSGFSQKYGHLNFGNLLSQMPTITSAEAELQSFNDVQIATGEAMVKELEKDFLAIQAKKDEITPLKLQEYEADFQKRQQGILKYEQEISVNIEKKRQELLGPIITEAREAINTVAKEKGLSMIFDSSLFNTLLFTEESTDMMAAVKAKLGIE